MRPSLKKLHPAFALGAALIALAPVAAVADTVVIATSADGDRIQLCGKADRAALDAIFGAKHLDFTSELPPEYFVEPYWGIAPTDAYVCLGSDRYNDSRWTLPGYPRFGGFNRFELNVLGFKIDANGNRVDVNGDGAGDVLDWSAMSLTDTFSGRNAADAKTISKAFAKTWGLNASPGEIGFSDYRDGYPNAVQVMSGRKPYFSAKLSDQNQFYCTGNWEECYTWGTYEGSEFFVAPQTGLLVQNRDFRHSENRWVKYDVLHDKFKAHDPKLADLLTSIQFTPTFWVLAKENKHDYRLP
jgi:hypothetical protein